MNVQSRKVKKIIIHFSTRYYFVSGYCVQVCVRFSLSSRCSCTFLCPICLLSILIYLLHIKDSPTNNIIHIRIRGFIKPWIIDYNCILIHEILSYHQNKVSSLHYNNNNTQRATNKRLNPKRSIALATPRFQVPMQQCPPPTPFLTFNTLAMTTRGRFK